MVLFTNWIRIAAIIRLNARYKGQKDPNIILHPEKLRIPFI